MVAAPARVSVALGSRNGERYLPEQLRSIVSQSLPPVEVVLSDDASSDATVRIAHDIVGATGSPRLIVLQNAAPLGVTRNFEQAARACTGDLIALSDQDDLWHPDRLARMVAEFDARPDLLLLHADARLVDAEGHPLGETLFGALEVSASEREEIHSGRAIEALMRRNLVTGATTVFRRSLLDVALPFPDGWVHDEWLAIIAASTGRVDFLDDALTDYRQHGANQIGARKLTLRGKLARLGEPRRARNARLASIAASLVERLDALGDAVSADATGAAREKLAHELVRSGLPAFRPGRLVPVAREWRTGRYRTCGRGVQDAVRDLLQPAG